MQLADGRNLQIQWMRGENPTEVAANFAQQHGIQEDEFATIVDFVRHAEAITSIPKQDTAEVNAEEVQESNEEHNNKEENWNLVTDEPKDESTEHSETSTEEADVAEWTLIDGNCNEEPFTEDSPAPVAVLQPHVELLQNMSV